MSRLNPYECILSILEELPWRYNATRAHILVHDLNKLSEYCQGSTKREIRKFMVPLIHRRTLQYGDTLANISEITGILGVSNPKFHIHDAELISAGFYSKENTFINRRERILESAFRVIRTLQQSGKIEDGDSIHLITRIFRMFNENVLISENPVEILVIAVLLKEKRIPACRVIDMTGIEPGIANKIVSKIAAIYPRINRRLLVPLVFRKGMKTDREMLSEFKEAVGWKASVYPTFKDERLVSLCMDIRRSLGSSAHTLRLYRFTRLSILAIDSIVKVPAYFVNHKYISELSLSYRFGNLEFRLNKLYKLWVDGLDVVNNLESMPSLKTLYVGKKRRRKIRVALFRKQGFKDLDRKKLKILNPKFNKYENMRLLASYL